MSAELIVRPGITIPSRDDFISSHQPYAIALDGYVDAPPFFERTPGGPYRNFDHHTGVDRFATRSAAQQVLFAVRMGLVKAYTSPDGEYRPTVYANDCDQDVALSWFMLLHGQDIAAQRDKKRGTPIRNLVDMAGDMDVTAGGYPYPPEWPLMRQIAWMFRPFTEARVSGQLMPDAEQHRSIIGQCCGRIGLQLMGHGQEVNLDTRYQVLGGSDTWKMFEEVGPEGRIGAFREGIDAFIIHKGQRPNGAHDYTIGRISEYIDFDLHAIARHLNIYEGSYGNDRWGCDGSGITGGSPRAAGSSLDPETLISIINDLSPTLSGR